MRYLENIRDQAKKNPKRIILPEGDESRILGAVEVINNEKIARPVLLSRKCKLKGAEVIDPEKLPRRDEIINTFYDLRKHKGVTKDRAGEIVSKDNVYFAALMVRLGMADGFVAGASHTTPDVARAAIYCLGVDKEIGTVSSSFIVEMENCSYGENGLFVFGDCGIMPDPDPGQLAGIAISSSALFKHIFDMEPKVALLSYSTKGSSKGPSVQKVRDALRIIKEKNKDLLVDGELQLDSAIAPEAAEIKCSGSPVAGKANVLIFPNLDAGNIAYKLVQRLAKARMVGPLLQGVTKPASDLSRGCGIQEIVDAVAVTSLRAHKGL